MKILIVEDESLIANQYQTYLHEEGYEEIRMCNSGEEAISICKTFKPDIILIDYLLKGSLSGLETSLEIKTLTNIPIVFITAFVDNIPSNKKNQLSETYFLDKPLDKGLLIEIINKYNS